MTGRLAYLRFPGTMFFFSLLSMGLTVIALFGGVTVNQALALIFTLSLGSLWFYDKFKATVAGILLFMIKPLFVRIAFMIDYNLSGSGGFDLLGITPALLLAGLIAADIYSRLSRGERICPDKPRLILALFAAVSFLSIFNPANSIAIGLGGFERNILPNMMILYLAASTVTSDRQRISLAKTLLLFGLLATLYGIGQYITGLFPWEMDWMRQVALRESNLGWLTVGLRGVEFRIFSVFYNYMDFFFTMVLVFALALSHKEHLTGRWRKMRTAFFISWGVMLALALERMPAIMTIAVMVVTYYLKSSPTRRKTVIWSAAAVVALTQFALAAAGPILKNTGAEKLIRLAEMQNPFAAYSLGDRAENFWGPALETIKANPLGVGIGYGSESKATAQASLTDYYIKPHNELIQKVLETGFIGGILYLILLIALFKQYRTLFQMQGANRALGLAMMAGSLAFFTCALVNIPLSGSSGLAFWAMAGVALGVRRDALNCNTGNTLTSSTDITNGGHDSLCNVHDGKRQ